MEQPFDDVHEDLRRAVARSVLDRALALNAACIEAVGLGCGVSVVGDALHYVAKADPRVPDGMIWEAPNDTAIEVAYSSLTFVVDEG